MIWFQDLNLDEINIRNNVNLQKLLGIHFSAFDEKSLSAKMPVSNNHKQTLGSLHGGATCVLAETLGSVASNYCLDFEKEFAVGLEINANHLRRVSEGMISAKAEIIHLGKKIHVWDIKVTNDSNQLISILRLTTSILSHRNE